ncbi:transcription factor S [Candidatus Woesearchaeota archaeon]|nr:transcription factor S [Candidatus Woesearchaeota archaeon]
MGLFCPKCGSIMLPKKTATETKMACGKCGHIGNQPSKITEKIQGKREIEVVEKKEDILPKTPAECSKCGNNEAYYWLIQTRAGDEPETKFLRCSKCEHTWRDYG